MMVIVAACVMTAAGSLELLFCPIDAEWKSTANESLAELQE